MAYQTGTALDPADLLDKLRLFALANGFTVNFWGDRSSGTAPRKALMLAKAGINGAFMSNSTAGTAADPGPWIITYMHDAYSAGLGTENQSNPSIKIYTNGCAGPYQAYHFFSDNGGAAKPYLYVVLEVSPGTFKHFGIGQIDPIGAITTGAFCTASNWTYTGGTNMSDPDYTAHAVPFDSATTTATANKSTQIRADSDGITPRWFSDNRALFGEGFSGGVRGADPSQASTERQLLMGLNYASASQRTGRTVLSPCLLAVDRTSNLQSLVGAPPSVRWCSLRYIEPGQTLTLGPDTWKVFPVIRKNGGVGQVNSGLYGFAYLVN